MARFLLIGLDGAEPSLVERWMAQGRLPHLAALRERGCYMPLASTRPPVTFPAWTTCVTGVSPGKHGIFDFTEVVKGRYALRFVNGSFRKAPALWNILSKANRRVGVLSVPATYPPEPVNGFMVSGFDSPVATSVDASFVDPPDYYDRVKDWRFADIQESHIGAGWHQQALTKLLAKIEDKERIACDLYAQEDWDFFMVVFGESDTVAHHFWLFHDPDSPRHEAGMEDAIAQVYERLDASVGRLVELAGEEVVVGVVSDHGFGGAGTGVLHLNNWLAQEGYLSFSGSGRSPLKELALRLVPVALRGALFRRFQKLASKAESKSRFGGIDWQHTTAWSEELNYFPSIRLNLKGREPEGRVAPEYAAGLISELITRLEAWEPVRKAWRREELFEGPEVDRAPEIILELNLEAGYSYSCLRSRGGPPFRRLEKEAYYGGKEKGMTGNHRDPGVLFLSEPVSRESASLADIAPTVLSVLGLPGPAMDGRSLLGEHATNATQPVQAQQATPYTAEEEAALEQRLRGLGYFE